MPLVVFHHCVPLLQLLWISYTKLNFLLQFTWLDTSGTTLLQTRTLNMHSPTLPKMALLIPIIILHHHLQSKNNGVTLSITLSTLLAYTAILSPVIRDATRRNSVARHTSRDPSHTPGLFSSLLIHLMFTTPRNNPVINILLCLP